MTFLPFYKVRMIFRFTRLEINKIAFQINYFKKIITIFIEFNTRYAIIKAGLVCWMIFLLSKNESLKNSPCRLFQKQNER